MSSNHPTHNFDIVIIGAGPSGSTAAAFLAQSGHRVLLLEKSRFPREKLCGEFITPECLPLFDRLGVREAMFDAGAKMIRRWTLFSPDGRGIEVPMAWIADGYNYAIGLTRARMDAILLERARQLGVEVREGFQVSPHFSCEEELGIVEGKADGGVVERFVAPIVIDASGRNGVFAAHRQPRVSRFEGSRLFGCKVHLREIEGVGEKGELFFFRDGYGGLSNIEGERTNLCFITTEATLREAKGDREKLLDLTLRTNPMARERLQRAVLAGEWLGTGPLSYGRASSLPGVIAIGDAGAFIDPFTGSGILLALTSGEVVANIIHQTLIESGRSDADEIAERYDRWHRSQFGLRFRACSMLRSLAFKPWARNLFVTTILRHQRLARLVTLSTRQRLLSSNR